MLLLEIDRRETFNPEKYQPGMRLEYQDPSALRITSAPIELLDPVSHLEQDERLISAIKRHDRVWNETQLFTPVDALFLEILLERYPAWVPCHWKTLTPSGTPCRLFAEGTVCVYNNDEQLMYWELEPENDTWIAGISPLRKDIFRGHHDYVIVIPRDE